MTVEERQLRIVGVLENVSVACDFVVEQAREAGLDDRALHHCYLAVDEACTNIIEHGYKPGCETCMIDVFCQRSTDALIVTIMDDSPAFNPMMHPDPDPRTPLDEREVGGWGIFFIKKLMDKVTYSYEGRRNRLVMVKKIPSASHPLPTHELPALRPIEMRPLTDKVWMITPSGYLDGAQTPQLASAITEQMDAGHRWLILNMADVDGISSSGLKMLVTVGKRARDQKGDLALAALNPLVLEMFQLVGLDLVFTIAETPDQARTYFTSKMK